MPEDFYNPEYIQKNKVFMSWSKGKSQKLASLLKSELEIVFQNVEVWISTEMGQGKYDHQKITTNAATSEFCICILDHENYTNFWPIFEAGMFYGYPSKEIFVMLCGDLTRNHLSARGHPIEGNFCILSDMNSAETYIINMVDTLNERYFKLSEARIERARSSLAKNFLALHKEQFFHQNDADINSDDILLDQISGN